MKPQFRMDARPVLLFTAAAGALLLCVVLLLLAMLVHALISWLALILLVVALGAGLAAEVLVWVLRGIRCVEIDADTLTICRGRSLAARRSIPRASVIAVRTARRFGRRIAVLRLDGLRPNGPRPKAQRQVRIAEDAFPREQFTRFLAVLETWRRG
jgi:hypothetical protein